MDRRDVIRMLGAAASAFLPSLARAEDTYPSRPIKLIAPVAPGGGVDLVARTIGDRLGPVLGQPFVVENQSGGGGVIASQATSRAAPDGYTLMVGYVGTHGTNPAVRKLPYDALNGFTHIAMVGGTPNVLVVNPNVPAKTLAEFVAYAKTTSRLSYGSAGTGTLTHLAMEQFKEAAKISMSHVPYRGISPALFDALAGQTQAVFPGLAAALPHIKGEKLRALAVTGKARHHLLPDVPTLDELGYSGFDGVQWYAIMGPPNLPQPIVARLNTEINKLLASPDLTQRLSGEALDPMPMRPQEVTDYVRRDIAKWTEVVKAHHLEMND